MVEHHLDIATADGAMNSFVVCPEEGGPFPVVLFYMDAPGKREELHDMARRLAAVGYYVVLLAFRDVDDMHVIGQAHLLQRDADLAPVGSVEAVKLDAQAGSLFDGTGRGRPGR